MNNINNIIDNNIEYVGIDYHTKFAVATRMSKEGIIILIDREVMAITSFK